jgi:tape measure domain-containing protein
MAAGPTKELETLLIRLAGDGSQYASMMKNAVAQTTQASTQISKQQKNIQVAAQQAEKAINAAYYKTQANAAAATMLAKKQTQTVVEQTRAQFYELKRSNDASIASILKVQKVREAVQQRLATAEASLKAQAAIGNDARKLAQFYELKRSNEDAMAAIIKQQSAVMVSTQQVTAKQVEGAKQVAVATSQATSQIKVQNSEISNTSKTLYQHAKAIDHTANRMMDMGRGMSFYVTAPIVAAGVAMTKMAADWERQEMVFSTLLGKDVGLPLLNNMQHLADVTPYVFKDISGAGSLLMGAGMDAGKILDTVRMLGDVAAGTGADLWSLSNVYAQIMNMGHLKGQDKLQLTSNRFPIKEIANTMGITMEQFPKMMEEGKISFAIVEKTFQRLTSEGGRFNNLMDKLNKTTVGTFSNFLDMIQKTGRELGKTLLPPANELMGILSNALAGLRELTPEFTLLSAKALAAMAVIGPVLFGLGLVLKPIGVLTTIITSIGGATGFAFLTPLIGSVLAFATIMMGVVAGFKLINNLTDGGLGKMFRDAAVWAGILNDETDKTKPSVEELRKNIKDQLAQTKAEESIAAEEKKIEQQRAALVELEGAFTSLFDTLETKGVAALNEYNRGLDIISRAEAAGLIGIEKRKEALAQLQDAYTQVAEEMYKNAYTVYITEAEYQKKAKELLNQRDFGNISTIDYGVQKGLLDMQPSAFTESQNAYQTQLDMFNTSMKSCNIAAEKQKEILDALAETYKNLAESNANSSQDAFKQALGMVNDAANKYRNTLEAVNALRQQMDVSPAEQEFIKNKNVLYDAWQQGIIGVEEYENRVNMLWADATGMIPDAWLPQQQQMPKNANEYSRMLNQGVGGQQMTANDYSRMMGYGMLGQPEPYFDPSMMMPEQRVKRDEAGETSAGGLWGLMQSAGATQKTTEEEMSDKITRTNELLQMLYEKSGSSW